jgi:hypothetical protein
MRDDAGRLWFGYPRPKAYSGIGYGAYGMKFELAEKIVDGMGYFCHDFKGAGVEGTDMPWLFTSGCLGLLQCDVPLLKDGEAKESGLYTVRLGFLAPAGDGAGQRVFDVKLEGKPVLANFDILQSAGGPKKAVVKEFKGIKVSGALTVELVPKVAKPTAAQGPVLNWIEAIREDTRKASMTTP